MFMLIFSKLILSYNCEINPIVITQVNKKQNGFRRKEFFTKMSKELEQRIQSLKIVEDKVECQNKIWKKIKNECIKSVAIPLPLDTPLNPDKVF